MDIKVNAGSLVSAIADPEIHVAVGQMVDELREQAISLVKHFADEAGKAERYLRRYHRSMNYASMKSRGYPIGSGIVESACKRIVSERMKLSGMRWHKEGGQRTMTLRCLLLSGIWDTVYKKRLADKPTVSNLIKSKAT